MEKEVYYYNTIASNSVAEYKDKNSKFLAYAFPTRNAEEYKTHLAYLKKLHPKANHFCFAYRLGTDGNTFRSGDDGEPSGSAGRPILGQIDSKEVTDVLVVVVRYFGGIMLGVPGLINAYKTSAALALQLVPIIRNPVMVRVQFDFDYTRSNDIMHWLKKYEGKIIQQETHLFCTMECAIPKQRQMEAQLALDDLLNISWKWL